MNLFQKEWMESLGNLNERTRILTIEVEDVVTLEDELGSALDVVVRADEG